MKSQTISILGCGWFGLSLAKDLLTKGCTVKGSTTSSEKLSLLNNVGIKPYLIDFSREEVYHDEFFDCDVLFIAIPPKRKSGEASIYPQKIKSILRVASQKGVTQIILISSTGVYENSNRHFNEQDIPQPNTDSGKALLLAENIAREQDKITTTILRFGGLYGPGRDPGRFFAGKKNIPNGLAPINMIHLDDCIGISLAIIGKEAFGQTYNACSPQHPSRTEFYTFSAREMNFAMPEFIPELIDWKIVDSVNVPAFLDYHFSKSLT